MAIKIRKGDNVVTLSGKDKILRIIKLATVEVSILLKNTINNQLLSWVELKVRQQILQLPRSKTLKATRVSLKIEDGKK